jgi:adenylate cyclase
MKLGLSANARSNSAMASGLMGMANYKLKRYADAVRLLRDCTSREANILLVPRLVLASAYAQLGQVEEARAEIAEVLRIDPNITVAKTKRIYLSLLKNPSDAEHSIDGLRKAGLPET